MLRKQAEADRLRERISSLEYTIEAMSHEFIEFGDRAAYSSQTEGKVQILEDLKQTTTRFLEFARAAEMAAGDEEGTTSFPTDSQGKVVSEASQSLAEVNRQVNQQLYPFQIRKLVCPKIKGSQCSSSSTLSSPPQLRIRPTAKPGSSVPA
jgi:hypothetical protein